MEPSVQHNVGCLDFVDVERHTGSGLASFDLCSWSGIHPSSKEPDPSRSIFKGNGLWEDLDGFPEVNTFKEGIIKSHDQSRLWDTWRQFEALTYDNVGPYLYFVLLVAAYLPDQPADENWHRTIRRNHWSCAHLSTWRHSKSSLSVHILQTVLNCHPWASSQSSTPTTIYFFPLDYFKVY